MLIIEIFTCNLEIFSNKDNKCPQKILCLSIGSWKHNIFVSNGFKGIVVVYFSPLQWLQPLKLGELIQSWGNFYAYQGKHDHTYISIISYPH